MQDGDVLSAIIVRTRQIFAVDINVTRSEYEQFAADRLNTAVIFNDRIVHRHADRRAIENVDTCARIGDNAPIVDTCLDMVFRSQIVDLDEDRSGRRDDVGQIEQQRIEFANRGDSCSWGGAVDDG